MKSVTLLLIAFPALVFSASTEGTHDGNSDVPIDPNTGQSQVIDIPTQQQALIDEAAKTLTAIATADTGGAESIYTQLIIDNQMEKNVLDDQTRAKPPLRGSGASLKQSARGNFRGPGLVTDSPDIDINSNMSPPRVVHFIGGGPNRLQSLNNSAKRATNWLNKHTCGGFDWQLQFQFQFKADALKEYLMNLGEGIIAAAPMALLSAYFPQTAEIIKHLQYINSMDLNNTEMKCQQIQASLTNGINKARWASRHQQCLEENKDLGEKEAITKCQNAANNQGWTEQVDGSMANSINSAAAASSDWNQAAQDQVDTLLEDPAGTSHSQRIAAKQAAASTAQALNPNDVYQAGEGGAVAGSLADANSQRVHGGITDGAKSVFRDMFGSAKFTASGGMEIGKARFKLYDLKVRSMGVGLANNFFLQLAQHWDLLTATFPSSADLRASYDKLTLWTWNARGGASGNPPWTHAPYNELTKNPEAIGFKADGIRAGLSSRITDSTMDRLAILLARVDEANANNDTEGALFLQNRYKVREFIDALCMYEYSLYLEKKYEEARKKLEQSIANSGPSGAEKGKMFEEVLKNAQEVSDKIMKTIIANNQSLVITYLPIINSYTPGHTWDGENGGFTTGTVDSHTNNTPLVTP